MVMECYFNSQNPQTTKERAKPFFNKEIWDATMAMLSKPRAAAAAKEMEETKHAYAVRLGLLVCSLIPCI